MKIPLLFPLLSSLVFSSPLTALSGESPKRNPTFQCPDNPTNQTLVSVEMRFVETKKKVKQKPRALSRAKADKLLATLKKQGDQR